jgi:serine O-acetyltransferase
MSLDDVKASLLASYEADGGINHLDGTNLPAQESVNALARDLMHLLFPGYFSAIGTKRSDLPNWVGRMLQQVDTRLVAELEKCLRFARRPDPGTEARSAATALLTGLPALRRLIQSDVTAAYHGDPAALSVEEIILAYPCVLVIALQRVAHVLYREKVPLLPRMLTEFAHERTGADIHPGAQIGPSFFIDHCTGVVIGETATIGAHAKLYQGVTLGAKSFEVDLQGNPVKSVKRHPDIEDHVTIYAHATILGGTTRIGAHSVIGGNVWLLDSVPANSIAYFKGDNLVVRKRSKQEQIIGDTADWQI